MQCNEPTTSTVLTLSACALVVFNITLGGAQGREVEGAHHSDITIKVPKVNLLTTAHTNIYKSNNIILSKTLPIKHGWTDTHINSTTTCIDH